MHQIPPGYGGRLRPDDEIYRADRSWLGPTGYTLPFRIPYRAIPVAVAVFLPLLPLLRLIGAGGLLMYLADLVLSCLAAAVVVRFTSTERPVSAMAAILAHEISAPRPPRQPGQPVTVTLRPGLVPVHDAASPPARRQRRGARR
jgi:hypothetical protein